MNVTDLRLYFLNITALTLSMTDIDVVLKIVLLSVSIGYTLHKWYLLYGKSK